MRTLGIAIACSTALLLADAAAAQRVNTRNISCNEARGIVASRGEAVLSTGRHTFDRYVAAPRFCRFGDYAYPASVPTRDTRNCPIGYRCDSNPPLWEDRFSHRRGWGLR